MKWIRIFGVTGTAFFSTLGGLLTIDGLLKGAIPPDLLIPASLLVAGIQGGLAFFREITEQCDTKNVKGFFYLCDKPNFVKLNKVLNQVLLW